MHLQRKVVSLKRSKISRRATKHDFNVLINQAKDESTDAKPPLQEKPVKIKVMHEL